MKTKDKNNLIRWGIFGCGDVTEVKSGPAYQQTDGFELVAVMRRDEAKAKDYANRHEISKVYTDANALIADPDVDAVYIATPPDSHAHYALEVAAAGKPCCIEKPMAPTHKECLSICAAFEARNSPLFVAYYRRTLPRFTQIKTWLDEGEIGAVRHVNWQLSKPPSAEDLSKEYNWRTDIHIAAGGYFDDLASHGLDLIAFYLGNFKDVAGFATNQQGLYSAKDALAASWIHESGVTGTGNWNFGSALHQDQVEILGSKGTIEFAVFDDLPIRLTTENGTEALTIEHPRHVQQYHVEAMRDALLKNGSHPSSGKTAAHTAWVMDQILGRI
jgi:1,5-anhydro-D-fructose reductase (1,5-anhydro-D-mannitol-forming)